jgi:hypothetical protein
VAITFRENAYFQILNIKKIGIISFCKNCYLYAVKFFNKNSKMNENEILKMLVVLAKRIEEFEHKVKGGSRLVIDQTYLNELRKEASKIKDIM